ncbi:MULTISPECIES: hypothetical protein [Nocardia]|nr:MULTISPECIES: hypothetical protein [Nocardia]
MAATLTTDPTPTCGHVEDCTTLRDTQTGEWVTYCGYAEASALETAA